MCWVCVNDVLECICFELLYMLGVCLWCRPIYVVCRPLCVCGVSGGCVFVVLLSVCL